MFDRKIANIFDAPAVVDAAERSPSILNGGLGKVNPLYWIICLGTAAAIDLKQNQLRESSAGTDAYPVPGDLGWDPLGLYPDDPEGQFRMQTAEVRIPSSLKIRYQLFRSILMICFFLTFETDQKRSSCGKFLFC